MSTIVRSPDWQPMVEAIEQRLALSVAEEVRWVILQERDSWNNPGPCKLITRTWSGQPTGQYSLQLVPLLDEPIPLRLNYDQHEQLVQLFVKIEPREAFLAPPPQTIQLRFIATDEAAVVPRHFTDRLPGVALSGTLVNADSATYQFWMPPGQYSITSDHSEMEMTLDRDSRILECEASTELNGEFSSPVAVRLHPDERYISFCFIDSAGYTLDLAADLIPDGSQFSGLFLRAGGWPRQRFIRPGIYQAIIASRTDHQLRTIGDPVSWPARVQSDGRWAFHVEEANAFSLLIDSE